METADVAIPSLGVVSLRRCERRALNHNRWANEERTEKNENERRDRYREKDCRHKRPDERRVSAGEPGSGKGEEGLRALNDPTRCEVHVA